MVARSPGPTPLTTRRAAAKPLQQRPSERRGQQHQRRRPHRQQPPVSNALPSHGPKRDPLEEQQRRKRIRLAPGAVGQVDHDRDGEGGEPGEKQRCEKRHGATITAPAPAARAGSGTRTARNPAASTYRTTRSPSGRPGAVERAPSRALASARDSARVASPAPPAGVRRFPGPRTASCPRTETSAPQG